MRLIVNADEFGLTEGVCNGIIETFEVGLVRSTSMLATTEHFDYAVRLLKRNPDLGVGVHLTLTYGRPLCADLQTLTDKQGNFYRFAEFRAREASMDVEEMISEFDAQIERIKSAGLDITHLSTHQRILKSQKVYTAVVALAEKYGLCVRNEVDLPENIKTTDVFSDKFANDHATELSLKMLVKKFQSHDSMEVMCRPGYCDMELIKKADYNKKRETDLYALCRLELISHFEKNNIDIINYGEL